MPPKEMQLKLLTDVILCFFENEKAEKSYECNLCISFKHDVKQNCRKLEVKYERNASKIILIDLFWRFWNSLHRRWFAQHVFCSDFDIDKSTIVVFYNFCMPTPLFFKTSLDSGAGSITGEGLVMYEKVIITKLEKESIRPV